jgi:hypothetical protein
MAVKQFVYGNSHCISVNTGHAAELPVVGKPFKDRIDFTFALNNTLYKLKKKGKHFLWGRKIITEPFQHLI